MGPDTGTEEIMTPIHLSHFYQIISIYWSAAWVWKYEHISSVFQLIMQDPRGLTYQGEHLLSLETSLICPNFGFQVENSFNELLHT